VRLFNVFFCFKVCTSKTIHSLLARKKQQLREKLEQNVLEKSCEKKTHKNEIVRKAVKNWNE
jgi:hypothetical protein